MKYADLVKVFGSTAISLALGVSCAVANPSPPSSSPTEATLQRGMDLFNKEKYKAALDLWIPLAANGERVVTDPSRAVSWYRKAADQGDAARQFHFGLMYAEGTGVPKDGAQAVAWYQKSSAQGNPTAQFLLADAYRTGTCVVRDLDHALDLYQKSAQHGFEGAKVIAEVIADNTQHEVFQALPTREPLSTLMQRPPQSCSFPALAPDDTTKVSRVRCETTERLVSLRRTGQKTALC
jgi:TPR repeat protein